MIYSIMKININDMKKSELKNYVHNNGFFSQAVMNGISRDVVENRLKIAGIQNTTQITDSIPEGDNIFIYEGIISQQYGKGERNRNGYKIDKNWWIIDEYMYNPAILLMHDTDKGVIGNMLKMWVNEEWLNAIFWVDINNISEEWIRNQIKTGTLRATSTWSLVDEYMFEDTQSGFNYTEEQAEEKFGEWEVFLAYIWASDKLILNITKSVLLEVSMVTIWSNYKAVHSDTMSNYFSNLIQNKMKLSKEQLEEMKASAVDTTEKEVETPEGTEAEITTPVSENDTPEEVTETPEVEEVPTETTDDVETETTEEVVEEEVPSEETEVTPEEEVQEEVPAIDEEKQNLIKENEELKNRLSELEKEMNTPVMNTQLSKTVAETPVKTQDELTKEFFTNTVWNARI